ncbi:MAG TPA: zf-HC2 domain-containing protein [Pyrinomonadaceae bacterium]|nr:zf-HC2 domain-containing protein [Pyrinomonadaceae bacterium]
MSSISCEETRQTLSLYIDDCVSLPARVAIDEHLNRCPVCRAEVAELRSLTRSLSLMTRPTAPAGLTDAISDLLTIEAAARRQAPNPSLSHRIARFLEPRLMPYTVGSFASVIMFFLMFAALRPHFVALREAALQANGGVILLHTASQPVYDLYSPEDFARSRSDVSELSPTLNPSGRLAALTRGSTHLHASYTSDDDDMIVGLDVFSNGAASLADVVQAPRDRRMLDEFESALRQDAPFVPASYDRRPDTMRVFFTVGQKVDVDARNF